MDVIHNWIAEYNDAIIRGKVRVGKWVKRIYKKLIDDLENGRYFYDASLADRAIEFIENFCHHSKGRRDLLTLELWQKAFISAVFGLVDAGKIRIYTEIFLVVGKKNGKSLLGAAMIAYKVYVDEEDGQEVYCVAPKLKQASIVHDLFYRMTQVDQELKVEVKKRRDDLYFARTNTTVQTLAFNASKSDGFNPSMVTADEVAAWSGDSGLKQYEALKSAAGARRDPLMLSITTAGYVNDSIYDELIKRATALLKGSSKETHFLPVLYMIDDPEKWQDFQELEKANPNIGISVRPSYFREEMIVAENSLSKKNEFLVKYCNIKQNSSVAWLNFQMVEASAVKKKLSDFRDHYCVGGVDLSQTTDLTTASIIIEKKEKLYCFGQFFMPQSRIETLQEEDGVPYGLFVRKGLITPSGENYVDYKDVFNWFIKLLREYKIRPLKIGYDRYSSQYLVDDLKGAGFHTDDVIQGENLTGVIKEVEGLYKDGKIKIGGDNNLLRSHILNVALKQNLATRKVRPVKITQRARIDGMVSLLDAFTVRQKYYQEIGKLLKNDRKKEGE